MTDNADRSESKEAAGRQKSGGKNPPADGTSEKTSGDSNVVTEDRLVSALSSALTGPRPVADPTLLKVYQSLYKRLSGPDLTKPPYAKPAEGTTGKE